MQAGGGQAVQWGEWTWSEELGSARNIFCSISLVPRSFCPFLEDVLPASQIIRCLLQSNEGSRKEWILSYKATTLPRFCEPEYGNWNIITSLFFFLIISSTGIQISCLSCLLLFWIICPFHAVNLNLFVSLFALFMFSILLHLWQVFCILIERYSRSLSPGWSQGVDVGLMLVLSLLHQLASLKTMPLSKFWPNTQEHCFPVLQLFLKTVLHLEVKALYCRAFIMEQHFVAQASQTL